MAQRVSDDDFIKAWKKFGAPSLVAKAVGLDVRGVYYRRKSIEEKRGILLETVNHTNGGRPKVHVPKIGSRVLLDKITGPVIVASDGHFWPGERSAAFDALIKLIPTIKPTLVVMNGDSFDGARISRHPPGGWASLPDVADELAAVKERHGEIEALVPRSMPLIWCAGNHDSRFTARLAQQASEYTKVHGFDIADHFPAWQFCWSLWINGHTVIKHRWHQGVHGAYNNVLKSGKSIVTGHTHRLQGTMFGDYNGVRWGIECGTLSDFGPESDKFAYSEDAPANWSTGFAVLNFDAKGRMHDPDFCRVIDGVAYFRGKPV